MSEPVRVHDCTTMVCTFGGLKIQGFGEGDFFTVTPPTDTFKPTVGAQGEVAVSRNPDKLHTIKFSLFRTSSANAVLGAYFAQQVAMSQAGLPIAKPFTAFDRNTGELWRAGSCWILQAPERKNATTVTVYEWTLNAVMDVSPDSIPGL